MAAVVEAAVEIEVVVVLQNSGYQRGRVAERVVVWVDDIGNHLPGQDMVVDASPEAAEVLQRIAGFGTDEAYYAWGSLVPLSSGPDAQGWA